MSEQSEAQSFLDTPNEAPWERIDWDYEEKLDAIIGSDYGPDDKPICLVHWHTPADITTLLEKAPELLEALKGIRDLAKYADGAFNPDIVKICDKAIAAVEGGK